MNLKSFVLTGLLVIGIARATSFGQLEFSVPAGWTVKDSPTGFTLTPGNLAAGEEVAVTLFPGKDFSGDFA